MKNRVYVVENYMLSFGLISVQVIKIYTSITVDKNYTEEFMCLLTTAAAQFSSLYSISPKTTRFCELL
jgi:hypothetical protein